MRQSHTAIVERNITWQGQFETEPYEVAWASEAIFFVRTLATEGNLENVTARVQISPDGIRWADEGSVASLLSEADGVTFVKVSHFGTFLRLVGELPRGVTATVIVALALKE